MIDAVKKYAGIDFTTIKTEAEAKALADEKGVHYEARHKKGDILSLLFEEFVEEHLVQPTFIMDHPVEISPLTKKKPEDPEYVERFELFINGWEMANAYSELNDPIDQRERFIAHPLLTQGGAGARGGGVINLQAKISGHTKKSPTTASCFVKAGCILIVVHAFVVG